MKSFLQKLWQSRLKSSLVAGPAVAIGIVVNHLTTGQSGQVQLPSQLAIYLLMLFVGVVGAVFGIAYSYHQELAAFKKEHEEERVTFEKIDFVRGKRTLSKWLAVCPKCSKPVADAAIPDLRSTGFAKVIVCATHCGWQIFDKRTVADITKSLEEIRP
jgi:ABC-type multidrug transport system fused ATPase/permease subunit